MTTVPTPHDALFRKFLGDVGVAQEFLQRHLPEDLRRRCDFATLISHSGSFVEDNLRTRISDMLYSLRTDTGTGYIYCLIEHQSRPDKLMGFRLMRYALMVMQQHLDRGHKRLPLVIPLLFYHGEATPYPYTTCWLDCFREQDRERAEALYRHPFPLVDVTVIPDAEFAHHPKAGLLGLVQKHIRSRDLNRRVRDIIRLLAEAQLGKPLVMALLRYLAQEGQHLDSEEFIRTLTEKTPEFKEDLMTMAEQWELKGREQGLHQGIYQGLHQGLQQGRSEEKHAIARNLLSMGMDRQKVKDATGLSDQELDNLPA
ncbi:Rpn family recombination-promoting nuclease/putative transposase [Martelella alba]|uniref:Rpn family recombination-promoting nuclease/putative transposase n=1 Tax=Martelella alba TaxID=2590451 RepID=A0ABY2SD30_9HYPH|nr:Rpn family recombination-promoting nuclease/putative transposase [Martelella alba]TKI01914.1 Rpn family recombination-promoting nuclease/putative transposase [Martelella alba]